VAMPTNLWVKSKGKLEKSITIRMLKISIGKRLLRIKKEIYI
jgi:hypothetical protein